jgi:hypothetical protein
MRMRKATRRSGCEQEKAKVLANCEADLAGEEIFFEIIVLAITGSCMTSALS